MECGILSSIEPFTSLTSLRNPAEVSDKTWLGSYLLIGNSQAAPATTSTIRNELDEPGDEAIQ